MALHVCMLSSAHEPPEHKNSAPAILMPLPAGYILLLHQDHSPGKSTKLPLTRVEAQIKQTYHV